MEMMKLLFNTLLSRSYYAVNVYAFLILISYIRGDNLHTSLLMLICDSQGRSGNSGKTWLYSLSSVHTKPRNRRLVHKALKLKTITLNLEIEDQNTKPRS